jgi:hypothetical protein
VTLLAVKLPGPLPLRKVQLHDIAGVQRVDGGNDLQLMSLNLRPAVRGQYHYC